MLLYYIYIYILFRVGGVLCGPRRRPYPFNVFLYYVCIYAVCVYVLCNVFLYYVCVYLMYVYAVLTYVFIMYFMYSVAGL